MDNPAASKVRVLLANDLRFPSLFALLALTVVLPSMLRNVASSTRQQHSLIQLRISGQLGPRQLHTRPRPPGKSPVRFKGLPAREKQSDGRPDTTRDERPKARVRYASRRDEPGGLDKLGRSLKAGPEMRLLRAPVLAERLTKLCDEQKYEDAVAMLKSAPLDAQNAIVWNTLISKIMKAQKFQLGFHLFIDVSILQFQPSVTMILIAAYYCIR